MGTAKRCLYCQKFFTPLIARTKFCCADHRIKYHQHKNDPIGKECANCGKPFMTTRKKQKFCSSKCKNEFHKIKVERKKVCLNCGNEFTYTNASQLYCSKICYRTKKRERDKEYYEAHKGRNTKDAS